jgi:hypothetical protein
MKLEKSVTLEFEIKIYLHIAIARRAVADKLAITLVTFEKCQLVIQFVGQ